MRHDRRDVEQEIKANTALCRRIADNETFAQHLYAALCNQQFYSRDADISTQEPWACSWRHAGGIIADIRNTHLHEPNNSDIREDYLHWYCSGMMSGLSDTVAESVVTDEMRHIFHTMGWDIVAYPTEWGV